MTTKIHEMFHEAEAAGEWFEYECLWQDCDCVRNTEMGYCTILTQLEADEAAESSRDTFYEIIRSDDTEFSPHYAYYYDAMDDVYYAVRKSVQCEK